MGKDCIVSAVVGISHKIDELEEAQKSVPNRRETGQHSKCDNLAKLSRKPSVSVLPPGPQSFEEAAEAAILTIRRRMYDEMVSLHQMQNRIKSDGAAIFKKSKKVSLVPKLSEITLKTEMKSLAVAADTYTAPIIAAHLQPAASAELTRMLRHDCKYASFTAKPQVSTAHCASAETGNAPLPVSDVQAPLSSSRKRPSSASRERSICQRITDLIGQFGATISNLAMRLSTNFAAVHCPMVMPLRLDVRPANFNESLSN